MMYLAYYFHKMEIIEERGQDGMAFKVQPPQIMFLK